MLGIEELAQKQFKVNINKVLQLKPVLVILPKVKNLTYNPLTQPDKVLLNMRQIVRSKTRRPRVRGSRPKRLRRQKFLYKLKLSVLKYAKIKLKKTRKK